MRNDSIEDVASDGKNEIIFNTLDPYSFAIHGSLTTIVFLCSKTDGSNSEDSENGQSVLQISQNLDFLLVLVE